MLASDIRRIAFLISAAVLLGWIFGSIALSLLIALAGYIVWIHRRLDRLLDWIRNRKHVQAPDPPGVFEDICREIDYLRERHKKRKKRLGNYLKQFQRATRALPDGTVVLDERGTVRWANKAATQNLGVRWPEDGGQRITNLIRSPELVDLVNGHKDDTSIDIPSPVDPAIRLNVRITPYGNEQRLFVARDITELHRANQIRSDFVANVSHELKTPITVLRGYLEGLARDDAQCPPTWRAPLSQMSDHVSRMQAIVDDLLMLSRLEQSDNLDKREPVDVPNLIADIHRQSRQIDAHADHMFALEVDTSLWIRGSDKELYSCFSNLVYNAVHYTGERGVVEIRWYRDDDGAHFSVKDNGIGIAAEHLPRLTERFYRADPSRARSHGGTGLGLAIVKHVLTRHRATLHVESKPGAGSFFRCDFPPEEIVETRSEADEINRTA